MAAGHRIERALFVAAVAVIGLAMAGQADVPSPLRRPGDGAGPPDAGPVARQVLPANEFLGEPEEGFVWLFNGQNLDGWVGDVTGPGYRVDDDEGRLICTGHDSGNLLTEREYANFVLRFEFKLDEGANNGLAIRSPNQQGSLAYEGMELQILHDEHLKFNDPNYDGFETLLEPWQHHGSLYGIAAAKDVRVRPPGRWNRQEVEVNGRRVKVTLNGEVILDVDIDEAMKDGAADGHEHPGAKRARGHIGFLGHSDYVEFRSIRIRELPPDPGGEHDRGVDGSR